MNPEKNKTILAKFLISNNYVHWSLLIGITIVFTIFLYPNLVIKTYPYQLGDVVEKDVKATKDFLIEDQEATKTKRREAIDNVLTLYDYDASLSTKVRRKVKTAFGALRALFEPEKSSQKQNRSEPPQAVAEQSAEREKSIHDRIWQMKEYFEQTIGITVSDGAYKILENESFSEDIADLIIQITTEIIDNGVVANKELLLREADKGIILRDIRTKTETAVYKLKQFYGLDQAKTMVRIIGQPLLKNRNYVLVNMIVDFVQGLIQPDITLNKSETEERKKNAVLEIKPIFYKIKAGEMLLREGERVTQIQLLKLKASQESAETGQILVTSIGSAMIILCILLTTYILHLKHQSHMDRSQNKHLLFIASVLITFFFIARISASLSESVAHYASFDLPESSIALGIPLASGAMTVCLFVGLDLAIPFAMLIAIGTAVIFKNRFDIFIYFFINGSLAAYWMQSCRERKVFIKAGLKLGLLNVALATAITFYMADLSGFKILWDWAFAFMGGVAAGIVTAGIAPLVEIAFDYTTDIKLLELANLDQPILRRLMLEAPGTYHHSVMVGSLVEAAAAEIGANSLLAKVCGYYHDIGKINKPLYFVENQTDGINRHDKLAPSMSSLILISHVKDGVEIAKQNKLGQIIIDTIRQSHGTSLISFFYEKAKKLKGEDAVKIEDFRYPGPRPQTREAGLVMLADVVEAASRTLANPTPSRIQKHVQDMINKIFSDGQLDNCELTLKDLHNIAKSFNKILNGIYHHRIEYPEQVLLSNGKGKNGSPDRQQPKQIQDISEENKRKGPGHLKRLGLS
ncbi:MAG: HDIG domain-containing metalloprotein [Pseudomonadota bacterium]|uniref:HDIG domain-containing protein n=1 Tax=Candidatus Desulfatibia profunda TaxID=2841695 RepID=A0A8J6NL46_9BACT|nr:HDIG domain-containing protein [Candidatus Desulfatibia profunda]MBL7179417.1 HDIG domain-containing protein [Desulfobacterales bacterium]